MSFSVGEHVGGCEGGVPGEGVPGVGILGFPKIEIERKPQRNFPIDLIKLLLEHKGGGAEERKVLATGWGGGWGLAPLSCFYMLATEWGCAKGKLWEEEQARGIVHFRLGDFLFQLPGLYLRTCSVGARRPTAHYRHPRKVQ